MNFGEKLDKLDKILVRLEQEQMPLEDSLAIFEEGVRLLKDCKRSLLVMEQKVTTLLDESEEE